VETHEIDRRLQHFTAAEHRIGANLQELEQHSIYQLISTDVLTGKTAKALGGAKNAELWDRYLLLSSVLDRASMSEGRVSIQQLIDLMAAGYEPIRNVVTHAETVLRDVLPRLNSAEASLSRMRSDAAALKLPMPELDQIEQTIRRIGDLSLTDPLSIPTNARDGIDGALQQAAATIAAARTSHDELANDMAQASGLLDECRDLLAHAEQNRIEALAKIAQPVGLRRPPSTDAIDGEKGLASRLSPIVSSTASWQQVRRELDGWAIGAVRLRDQLKRVEEANALPIQKRGELRGRLAAFRAKMAATGFSEDPALTELSAEAHNELFTAPTDLVRAEQLVTEFGNRLATS